jgi:hypothetical protein
MVDIEKIEKRTVQSFFDDGLFEIAVGFIFLLIGGYFFAQSAAPKGSRLEDALSMLFILVIVSSGFFVNRVVRFLKRRITYSRTGYVALKKKEISPKRRAAAAITGAVLGASLGALYGLSPSIKTLLPALNGLLFGIAVFFIANRIGLIRFYVLSAIAAIIGVAIAVARIREGKGFSYFYLIFGIAVIVSGLATLIIYLRRFPRPTAGASEGPDAH